MKRNVLTIASVLALGVASTSFAATDDGDLDTTSTGTADITLTIPKLIQITGMETVAFDPYSPGEGNKNDHKNICIYSNLDSGGTYKVEAHGDGAGNAFTLQRTGEGVSAYSLPYNVYYNDQKDIKGTKFTSGEGGNNNTVNGNSHFSNTVLDPCTSAGANANYWVEIEETEIWKARYGSYRGTLTLVVTPN